MSPIVECEQGVLLGRLQDHYYMGEIYVLSDPDLLSNHGIDNGDNAVLATRIVQHYLYNSDAPLVFDETCHGHLGGDGVFRKAFRFPLVLATTQFLIVIGLLLWCGLGRFGAPRHVAEHLEAGKELLISNSAALYHFAGYSGQALHRFFEATVQELTDRFHAPQGLNRLEKVEWLQKIADHRKIEVDLFDMQSSIADMKKRTRSTGVAIPLMARRIQKWKWTMLNVTRAHS